MQLSTTNHGGTISAQNKSSEFGEEGLTSFSSSSRKLAENKHFVLLPSMGPVGKVHLLLCSKRYLTGLHEFNQSEVSVFETTFRSLTEAFEKEYDNKFILFENGTVQGSSGGCSITHYHMHLVSLQQEIGLGSIDCDFTPLRSPRDAASEAHKFGNYLFIYTPKSGAVIGKRDHLKSQYMRKIVSQNNDVASWDWRLDKEPNDWGKARQDAGRLMRHITL